MRRAWRLAALTGVPVAIVMIVALVALLTARLIATSTSPVQFTTGDQALAETPTLTASTPTPTPLATETPTAATLPSTSLVGLPPCCQLTPVQPEEAASPSSTTSGEASGVAIETLDGRIFQVAAPRDRVVAVVSMAVGCASCIQELRAWAEIYPRYQAQAVTLVVLSINPFEDAATLERVLATVGVSDAVAAIDRDGEVSRALGIQTLDQTLIYDRAGQLTYSDAVPTAASTLAEALNAALAG